MFFYTLPIDCYWFTLIWLYTLFIVQLNQFKKSIIMHYFIFQNQGCSRKLTINDVNFKLPTENSIIYFWSETSSSDSSEETSNPLLINLVILFSFTIYWLSNLRPEPINITDKHVQGQSSLGKSLQSSFVFILPL